MRLIQMNDHSTFIASTQKKVNVIAVRQAFDFFYTNTDSYDEMISWWDALCKGEAEYNRLMHSDPDFFMSEESEFYDCDFDNLKSHVFEHIANSEKIITSVFDDVKRGFELINFNVFLQLGDSLENISDSRFLSR